MPLIDIKIIEGRKPEKIDSLIQNVTETVSNTLDAPKQNIRVIIHEIPKTHWSIGGVSAKNLDR